MNLDNNITNGDSDTQPALFIAGSVKAQFWTPASYLNEVGIPKFSLHKKSKEISETGGPRKWRKTYLRFHTQNRGDKQLIFLVSRPHDMDTD
jgi:hypothetical protein